MPIAGCQGTLIHHQGGLDRVDSHGVLGQPRPYDVRGAQDPACSVRATTPSRRVLVVGVVASAR